MSIVIIMTTMTKQTSIIQNDRVLPVYIGGCSGTNTHDTGIFKLFFKLVDDSNKRYNQVRQTNDIIKYEACDLEAWNWIWGVLYCAKPGPLVCDVELDQLN